jgi:tetratricopeptide (TPR) repeat protein
LRQRLACFAGWAVAAIVVSGVACSGRLYAEYHWMRAKLREAAGELDAARASLETAVATVPELDGLERTWLLAGKLDYLQGRATPQQRVFVAYQLARDKNLAQTVAHLEAAPWLITGALDEGGTSTTQGLAFANAQYRERRRGLWLLDDLFAQGEAAAPARQQAARIWTDVGLRFYRTAPVFDEHGPEYPTQDRLLTAAQAAWRRATGLAPHNRDSAFYLGLAAIRLDPDHPELAEAEQKSLINFIGDRVLLSDVQAILGDAYFEAGRLEVARRWYAASLRAFSLPKIHNHHGIRGLGGM